MLRVPFKCFECKYDTKSGSAKTQAPQQPAPYIYIYMYIDMCVHVHANVYVYVHVYVLCLCICRCVCIRVIQKTIIHTHTHTHARSCVRGCLLSLHVVLVESAQLRSWTAPATGLRMIVEGDPCSGWIRGRRIGSLRTLGQAKTDPLSSH